MRMTPLASLLALAVAQAAPTRAPAPAVPLSATAAPLRPGQEAEPDVDPRERYEALVEEVDEAYQEWVEALEAEFQAAEEEGREAKPVSMVPPFGPFIPRFQEAAADYAGQAAAIPFLMWLVEVGMNHDSEAGLAALDTLIDTHLASEELEGLSRFLPYLTEIAGPERGRELLERIESDAGSASLRGWAAFALVQKTLAEAPLDSEIYRTTKERLLEKVLATQDESLRAAVERSLREREVFSVGMVAPDIEGIDLDGVAFKLSDYKGRVIFVDFWGDW